MNVTRLQLSFCCLKWASCCQLHSFVADLLQEGGHLSISSDDRLASYIISAFLSTDILQLIFSHFHLDQCYTSSSRKSICSSDNICYSVYHFQSSLIAFIFEAPLRLFNPHIASLLQSPCIATSCDLESVNFYSCLHAVQLMSRQDGLIMGFLHMRWIWKLLSTFCLQLCLLALQHTIHFISQCSNVVTFITEFIWKPRCCFLPIFPCFKMFNNSYCKACRPIPQVQWHKLLKQAAGQLECCQAKAIVYYHAEVVYKCKVTFIIYHPNTGTKLTIIK